MIRFSISLYILRAFSVTFKTLKLICIPMKILIMTNLKYWASYSSEKLNNNRSLKIVFILLPHKIYKEFLGTFYQIISLSNLYAIFVSLKLLKVYCILNASCIHFDIRLDTLHIRTKIFHNDSYVIVPEEFQIRV